MSDLTSSVINIAPDNKDEQEEKKVSPNLIQSVQDVVEKPDVEKPVQVQDTRIDQELEELDLKIQNETDGTVEKRFGILANISPREARDNVYNVEADIVPRPVDPYYGERMAKIQAGNLSRKEIMEIRRAKTRKKVGEKPSASLLPPLSFTVPPVNFNKFTQEEHMRFAFDATSPDFEPNKKLYYNFNFVLSGREFLKTDEKTGKKVLKDTDKFGVHRDIDTTRYVLREDGQLTFSPKAAVQKGGLISFTGLSDEEKARLLNTVDPVIGVNVVAPNTFREAITAEEFGISKKDLIENGFDVNSEFLLNSIDGLKKQRLESTARGYVDAFGNPAVERYDDGKIKLYKKFIRDGQFAAHVIKNQNLSTSQKQEIIARYNDDVRGAVTRGATFYDTGVNIINHMISAATALGEQGVTITPPNLGVVPSDLIKSRTETFINLEKEGPRTRAEYAGGLRFVIADSADPDTGMVEQNKLDGILETTAEELGVAPDVLKEITSRNFGYVEDLVDSTVDPATYVFGAAGIGIINLVRYVGGTRIIGPAIANKYGLDNIDDVVRKIYGTKKNGAQLLQEDIAEAAEKYAANKVAKGTLARFLSFPLITAFGKGKEGIQTAVSERAFQGILRSPQASKLIISDQIATYGLQSKRLTQLMKEEKSDIIRRQLEVKKQNIDNRIAILTNYPNLISFNFKYGVDIKDEALAIGGAIAANRFFVNVTQGSEADVNQLAIFPMMTTSLAGAVGATIMVDGIGKIAARTLVDTVDGLSLAMASSNGSREAINAILDNSIEDPKLRARVKKDILNLSKEEFVALQESAASIRKTIGDIMEINNILGEEILKEEDVKITVHHLFGVSVNAAIDTAQVSKLDMSSVKDVSNLIKLRKESLEKEKEAGLVVAKVIEALVPHQDKLPAETLEILAVIKNISENQIIERRESMNALTEGLKELTTYTALRSGIASTNDENAAGLTLDAVLNEQVDRSSITTDFLEGAALREALEDIRAQEQEIISVNKLEHQKIKDSLDNAANVLNNRQTGRFVENEVMIRKNALATEYTNKRTQLAENNENVVFQIDGYRQGILAGDQYKALDFETALNLQTVDEDNLVDANTAAAINPSKVNEDEYTRDIIETSNDKEVLRVLQKLKAPTGLERFNAVFEPTAKRALIEASPLKDAKDANVIVTQTVKLIQNLPENLQKEYPIKSARFIDVYDWQKKFFTDFANGKFTVDDLGENAVTLLNQSTLRKGFNDPKNYSEFLTLEFNFEEMLTLRDVVRKKRNSLQRSGKDDEYKVVNQMLIDLDNQINFKGADINTGEPVNGQIILDDMQALNDIWRDRAIRYSTKNKGKGFEDNTKSKVLIALEQNKYEDVQKLLINVFKDKSYADTNRALIDTQEGQAFVKIFGGVKAADGLYYPTEDTAEQLRFLLRGAYAISYELSEAGQFLLGSLRDNNITSIPGFFNEKGFQIMSTRKGTTSLFETSEDIINFHENVQRIPLYSIDEDGVAQPLMDANGNPVQLFNETDDFIPLADTTVLAKTKKNRTAIKQATEEIEKVRRAYTATHNNIAGVFLNLQKTFDPTSGARNYEDILSSVILTDTGLNQWKAVRQTLSPEDQKKFDTMSTDLLGLHIANKTRRPNGSLDFSLIDEITNDSMTLDRIREVNPNIAQSLVILSKIGRFIYPPESSVLRQGNKPLPFRPESLFSKWYGIKNNKVNPGFVAVEFAFRQAKLNKFNAQSYLIQHPETAQAILQYVDKKTVLNINTARDFKTKVTSYMGRLYATEKFFTGEDTEYPRFVKVYPDESGAPTPNNITNLNKKLELQNQQLLMKQGVAR